jgi:hypothetical protein
MPNVEFRETQSSHIHYNETCPRHALLVSTVLVYTVYKVYTLKSDSFWLNKRISVTHSLTNGAEPFLRSRQLCSYSKTSNHFMEHEGSLPCSQEPSTGPYPEPDQCNAYHPLRSILVLSTHLRLGIPSDLFPSGFLINILCAFLFSPIRATCPAHQSMSVHKKINIFLTVKKWKEGNERKKKEISNTQNRVFCLIYDSVSYLNDTAFLSGEILTMLSASRLYAVGWYDD